MKSRLSDSASPEAPPEPARDLPTGIEHTSPDAPSRSDLARIGPMLKPKHAALLWRCGIAFADATRAIEVNLLDPELATWGRIWSSYS